MPRRPRKRSSLCIYHVILRGVNQQIIFEDDSDYQQFIDVLKYYKDKERCNFKLYAYCLMDNHIHLLIENTTIDLDEIMKRVAIKFVRWYNSKYQREGHLFQARYKSELVEDMEYLRIVFRYIHQNPLRAGIETVLGTYPWSSYHDYVTLNSSFIDFDKILSLFSNHAACMKYLHTISDKECMRECMENYSSAFSDIQALEMIQQKTSCKSSSDFQHLPLLKRNHYLKMLYHSGISVRQLSRLTGISRTAIGTVIQNCNSTVMNRN